MAVADITTQMPTRGPAPHSTTRIRSATALGYNNGNSPTTIWTCEDGNQNQDWVFA